MILDQFGRPTGEPVFSSALVKAVTESMRGLFNPQGKVRYSLLDANGDETEYYGMGDLATCYRLGRMRRRDPVVLDARGSVVAGDDQSWYSDVHQSVGQRTPYLGMINTCDRSAASLSFSRASL